jgi:exopolysaccharide biosynthesis polyprenyl glycosylphosphotransferase
MQKISTVFSTSGHLGRAERRPLRKVGPALRFAERKLLLAVVDLAVLNAALLLVLMLHPRLSGSVNAAQRHPLWFIVLSVVWLIVGHVLDIYDLTRAANTVRSVWVAGSAAILTSGVYLVIPYLTPVLFSHRLYALLLPVIATAGVVAWRVTYATVFVQPTFCQTALVIGAGQAGRVLARAVAETGDDGDDPSRGTGYRILGFIDDDPAKQGREIEGARVLGTRDDLPRLAQLLRPDKLIVAITSPERMHDGLFQTIRDGWEAGIPVTTMADLYERITKCVPVEHAGRDLHVVLPVSQPAGYRLYCAARRACEVALALLGLSSMLWLVPLVWLANLLISPGDLFYRQERVGKGGKTFQILKFRSMVMDAEKESGVVWARKGDARITPVGRLLRKTRLDEIPQFWNVLKGDMSLIGPRPERPEFVAQLAQEIPFYRVRHAVKPGITGWAQVKYRYGASVQDALIKLQYDLYYIKHQGLYLDLQVLLKSVQVVLRMQGQ